MDSQYRAFAECSKTQLTAGQSMDVDALVAPYVGKFKPKFMHAIVQEAGACTYKLQHEMGTDGTVYTLATTVVGQQIAGIKQITCTTGQIQICFFN